MKSRRIFAASLAAVLAATSTSIVAFAAAPTLPTGVSSVEITAVKDAEGTALAITGDDAVVTVEGTKIILPADYTGAKITVTVKVTVENVGAFTDEDNGTAGTYIDGETDASRVYTLEDVDVNLTSGAAAGAEVAEVTIVTEDDTTNKFSKTTSKITVDVEKATAVEEPPAKVTPLTAGAVTTSTTGATVDGNTVTVPAGTTSVDVDVAVTLGTGYTVVADETSTTDKNVVVVGGTYSTNKISATIPLTNAAGSLTLKYKVADGDAFDEAVDLVTITVVKAAAVDTTPALTVGAVTPKETIEHTKTTDGTAVTITLKEKVAANQDNKLWLSIPVTVADGKTLVSAAPAANGEVAVYISGKTTPEYPNDNVYTANVPLNAETGAGTATLTLTYKEYKDGALEETAHTLVTVTVLADIEDEGDDPVDPTPSTPTLTPATPVEPVASTTSNTSTTTSDATSSAAATVAPVEAKVEAEVKVGETVTVKSDDLGGDVTVATDKEDTALEGAKLEVEATNNVENTTKKLDAAVGADASAEVKELVKSAVKAVEDGNAVALDLSFTKDGKDVQPGKAVTVTAPVPAALKGADKIYVYHASDKGLEDVTDKCKYDKDKGTIAITNDAFSPYILSKVEVKAQAATSEASTSTTTSAPTTSNPNTGVALAVAPILLAGAAVTVVTISKKRK